MRRGDKIVAVMAAASVLLAVAANLAGADWFFAGFAFGWFTFAVILSSGVIRLASRHR